MLVVYSTYVTYLRGQYADVVARTGHGLT